jgi:hypothetical protein
VLRHYLHSNLFLVIIKEMHNDVGGGHFSIDITSRKILNVKYRWPTLHKDVQMYNQSYDAYQHTRNLSLASMARLVTTLLVEPFMKWALTS